MGACISFSIPASYSVSIWLYATSIPEIVESINMQATGYVQAIPHNRLRSSRDSFSRTVFLKLVER